MDTTVVSPPTAQQYGPTVISTDDGRYQGLGPWILSGQASIRDDIGETKFAQAAQCNFAAAAERIGNVEEAGKHYRRAVELAPKSGDTNNNYGQFLCAEGQYDEAQKYYAQAMRDPF